MTSSEIELLIRQLDADSTGDAEDAQAALTHHGRETDVITPLLRALPTLDSFGQLCAIEILQELGDARAGQPLTDLLTSEHDTVREWSARALGQLRVVDAIPALWRAYQACKERGDRPDWLEPNSIRSALTELGARHPVVPSLTASLRITTFYGHEAWPSTRLTHVLDDLAAHDQATLSFQLWRVERDGRMYWTQAPHDDTELDYSQPWATLARQAHSRARTAAVRAALGADVVATIEWIGRSDL
ncbi:HEAT repeat domain-containing protein [Amycolatopsis sp. lyj-90]|uniref:HEAT repeat domain-containing protein n=1 Tax=Amycolatopsis sp. lyj-90 TaxID=2789285 RepID=UPI00397CC1D1